MGSLTPRDRHTAFAHPTSCRLRPASNKASLFRAGAAYGRSKSMRDLKGKVAVVTGAASGIGLAMAERFASEGMKVVLADVEETPLAKAHDAILGLGAEAIAVRTDVSRWEQVEELARRSFETFGAAHVVCNNAGVSVPGLAWKVSQTGLGMDPRREPERRRARRPRLRSPHAGPRGRPCCQHGFDRGSHLCAGMFCVLRVKTRRHRIQ